MSLAEQRRAAFQKSKHRIKMGEKERREYEKQCAEYYSTKEGKQETIDLSLHASDLVTGKFKPYK